MPGALIRKPPETELSNALLGTEFTVIVIVFPPPV
jgi:hypothetical protein